MKFAFLDESGDRGGKGSKYLVLCLICTPDKKKIVKIIRETKKRLLEKNKTAKWLNRTGEIKFYKFPDDALLRRTLKKLSKVDIHIHALAFEKKRKDMAVRDKEIIVTQLIPMDCLSKRLPQLAFPLAGDYSF